MADAGDDLTNCSVCFEEYKETGDHVPRLLPCTHTLCEKCLQVLIRNSKLDCPECRVKHEATNGLRSFPQNKYIIMHLKKQPADVKKDGTKNVEGFEKCTQHNRQMSYKETGCQIPRRQQQREGLGGTRIVVVKDGGIVTDDGQGLINSAGVLAKKGDTGKYYCGRRVLSCWCCDGACGPDNGCNCLACQALDREQQGYRINLAGVHAKKGQTGKYYCGRHVLSCICCDGACGPDNGCNCLACQALDREEQGYRINFAGVHAKKGDTGKYYCGMRVLSCWCCDGACGPDNGCNCIACQALDREEQEQKMQSRPGSRW